MLARFKTDEGRINTHLTEVATRSKFPLRGFLKCKITETPRIENELCMLCSVLCVGRWALLWAHSSGGAYISFVPCKKKKNTKRCWGLNVFAFGVLAVHTSFWSFVYLFVYMLHVNYWGQGKRFVLFELKAKGFWIPSHAIFRSASFLKRGIWLAKY